jgi:cysteine desulfurase
MRVYLDNSATTRIDPQVLEAMLPYLREEFGNASSIHAYGQSTRIAIEEAREKVAALLGAAPREVIFTSGGTEADNFALRGLVEASRETRPRLITSTIEHPAVLSTCQALQRRGACVRYIPVDREARLSLEELKSTLSSGAVVVSIMHANNETGTIQDIARISEMAHTAGALFHTDAVQSVGKIPVDVRALGVDLLSLSGHKIHGPKGVGVLYARRGIEIEPLLWGGHQERGRRPGTENVAAIVGLGCAAEWAARHVETLQTQVAALRDRLEQGILSRVERQHAAPAAPHFQLELQPG